MEAAGEAAPEHMYEMERRAATEKAQHAASSRSHGPCHAQVPRPMSKERRETLVRSPLCSTSPQAHFKGQGRARRAKPKGGARRESKESKDPSRPRST